MKVETFILIENVDAERRLVSGCFINEEPNNLDQIFDYSTSKQIMQRWSSAFSKRTDGVNLGTVREMHPKKDIKPVGHITAIYFDDATKSVNGTAHISDDDVWKMVLAREYTGFSFGGRSRGKMWLDKPASKKFGRNIMRYTFDPVELSVVDSPRVPGTEFATIENADTEDTTMDHETQDQTKHITGADPTPESIPEATQPIENGAWTGGRLLGTLEDLSFLIKAVSAEKDKEGEGSGIPDALKNGLRALAGPVGDYLKAQADELAKGEDSDALHVADDDDFSDLPPLDMGDTEPGDVENGDYPGHPFHGNQHTGGSGATKASRASLSAHRATVRAHHESANKSGTGKQMSSAHRSAAKAHKEAAAMHKAKGNARMAAHHSAMAAHHSTVAKISNGDQGGDIQNGDLLARVAALEKKISKPIENADIAPVPARVRDLNVPNLLPAITKDVDAGRQVENGKTPDEIARDHVLSQPAEKQASELIRLQIATGRTFKI